MNSTRIEQAYDINQMIKEGKDSELTYATSSIVAGNENISFTYRNIYDEFIPVLKDKSIETELDEDNLIKFKYNPHLLAYVLYGTTDLWFLLLRINNMTRVTQFDKKKIKIIHPDDMKLINDIFIIREERTKKFQCFEKECE